MEKQELELLNALHKIIELDEDFLNNKQCNKYNELVDKAEEENLVW